MYIIKNICIYYIIVYIIIYIHTYTRMYIYMGVETENCGILQSYHQNWPRMWPSSRLSYGNLTRHM